MTQLELFQILNYNPWTGLFRWLISSGNKSFGDIAGSINSRGYLMIRFSGKVYSAHRLAWLWMTGEWPLNEVDHKDTNKLNNIWTNLREATRQQNEYNKSINIRNKSGYKGVCWHIRDKKWHAMIKVNGKQTHIGQFNNLEDAVKARQEYGRKLHGEFARE
jgi:HNH endonuclease